jgi:transcriptional regulator GlxA family with amidase domain
LGQSDISEGIQNCIKEITQNLDNPPTIEQLAKSMSISETAFRKIFRQQVGYSPLDFINRQRVREA